jgi:hypothetical protein
MAFNAKPNELMVLAQAVEEYCYDCGIVDRNEHLYVAGIVSLLFDRGASSHDELRRGLDLVIGPRSIAA